MTAGKDRHNMGTPVWIGYAARSAILLMSARPVEKMEVRCPSFPPVWHSVFMERSTMGKATRNSNGSDDTGVHRASACDQPQGPFSTVCGTAGRDRHYMGAPVWIGYAARSAILLMSERPVEKMVVRCPLLPPGLFGSACSLLPGNRPVYRATKNRCFSTPFHGLLG